MADSNCCNVELLPSYESEPFTAYTVIGAPTKSWITAWVCSGCGLMYSPSILRLPDPKEEARVKAKEERDRFDFEEFLRKWPDVLNLGP